MYSQETDGEGLAIGVLLIVLVFAVVAYRTPPTGPLTYYELYVPAPHSSVGFAFAQLEPSLWTRRARCGVNGTLRWVAGEAQHERCRWRR